MKENTNKNPSEKGKNMKKNTKVIIMTAKAANGNDLTYRTMAPLNWTVADACKMRNVSMLSILSATVSAPMTEGDALEYMQNDMLAQMLNPNIRMVKGTIGMKIVA